MSIGINPPLPSPALEGKRIILASNSPRRRQLLGTIIPAFECAQKKEIEESYPANLPTCKVPEYLSALKADAYKQDLTPNDVLITADTVVVSGNEILGKPHSREEAIAMLQKLSGSTHTVITGVSITNGEGKTISFSEHTKVTFGAIPQHDIELYVDTYRPFDKAGSYGIQEWIGAAWIEKIEGCYYNVMGLPLHALYTKLTQL